MQMLETKETNLTELNKAITESLAENMKVVNDYKNGKTNAVIFLVGVVMRKMQGKADANVVKSEIIKKLK
jgi:aspartyl-tRNA(Asn)/glutamyl-tRNA(Gln) amidotransferase subunit B